MRNRSIFLFVAVGLLALVFAGCSGEPPYSHITQRKTGAYVRFVNTLSKPAVFFVDVSQVSAPVPTDMGSTFVRESLKKHRIRAEIDGKEVAQTELELKDGDVVSGVLIESEGKPQIHFVTGEQRLPAKENAPATITCAAVGETAPESAKLKTATGDLVELSAGKRQEAGGGKGTLSVGSKSHEVSLEEGLCYTVLLFSRGGQPSAVLLRNTPRDFIYTQASDGKAG